jgi:hypothetical protein
MSFSSGSKAARAAHPREPSGRYGDLGSSPIFHPARFQNRGRADGTNCCEASGREPDYRLQSWSYRPPRVFRCGDGGLVAGALGWGLVVGGTTRSGVILLSLLMAAGLAGATPRPIHCEILARKPPSAAVSNRAIDRAIARALAARGVATMHGASWAAARYCDTYCRTAITRNLQTVIFTQRLARKWSWRTNSICNEESVR